MLRNYYLDEVFEPRFLEWIGEIRSEECYVNMGIAWDFVTALAVGESGEVDRGR